MSTVLFVLGVSAAMVIILLLSNTAHKSLGDLPQPPMDSGLHFDPAFT